MLHFTDEAYLQKLVADGASDAERFLLQGSNGPHADLVALIDATDAAEAKAASGENFQNDP